MAFSNMASMIAPVSAQGAMAPEGVSAPSWFNQAKLMKCARRCLLGPAILAIICPTVASASQDSAVYSGSACQPFANNYAFSRDAGIVYNASGTLQYWTCPVMRDWDKSGSIEYGQVTFVHSSGQRPDCYLYSRTEEGKLVGIGFPEFASTSTAGVYKFTFGKGTGNAVKVATVGSLYFECRLYSLRSGIVSYRVTENVDED